MCFIFSFLLENISFNLACLTLHSIPQGTATSGLIKQKHLTKCLTLSMWIRPLTKCCVPWVSTLFPLQDGRPCSLGIGGNITEVGERDSNPRAARSCPCRALAPRGMPGAAQRGGWWELRIHQSPSPPFPSLPFPSLPGCVCLGKRVRRGSSGI